MSTAAPVLSKDSPEDAFPAAEASPRRRRLRRNLPAQVVLEKLREAERLMEAGEYELGFYLLELRDRKLYRLSGCSTFEIFIRNKTGLTPKKARDLLRVAGALEKLPAMNEAFARGEIYWSAVRAMVSVATAETESEWVDYARIHSVAEVERRVSSSRRGEGPREHRWGGRPTRYPYRFHVKPQVHGAFESLTRILSAKNGAEMTVDEALFEAAQRVIAEEIERDGTDGKERILPASYRLVIYTCRDCGEKAAATPDGPEPIPDEDAAELAEGAEVLELPDEETTGGATPNGEAPSAVAGSGEPESVAAAPGERDSEADRVSHVGHQSSQVLLNSEPRIEHRDDLSTPGGEPVPPEERDRPNTPEENRAVLSRDGYFCIIPGCGNLARKNHHLRWRVHGGPTAPQNSGGLCDSCHDACHGGDLLMSGSAGDLSLSDRALRPLFVPAGNRPKTIVYDFERRQEVERSHTEAAPPSRPTQQVAAGGEGDLLDIESLTALPAEIDAAWWRRHHGHFEWCGRRRLWLFRGALDAGVSLDAPDEGAGAGASGLVEGAPGRRLGDLIGQESVRKSLTLAIEAARLRGELPPPILLVGPPGLGKTTLARAVALELGGRLHTTVGASLADTGCLVGILATLRAGDTLIIDEIHHIPLPVAECLYGALDEGVLPLAIASGSETRVIRLRLEPFLLVGATTAAGLLPEAFRSRFLLCQRLDYYTEEDLARLAGLEARARGVRISPQAARILARGARETPRILLGHLLVARDVAQTRGGRRAVTITAADGREALRSRGIDEDGLGEVERRILDSLLSAGKPLGLRTLADLVGEEERTLLEVHEPYLVRRGLIRRTREGRVATERAIAAGEPAPSTTMPCRK